MSSKWCTRTILSTACSTIEPLVGTTYEAFATCCAIELAIPELATNAFLVQSTSAIASIETYDTFVIYGVRSCFLT